MMRCSAFTDGHMAITAENVAERYGITRQECDELALISHQRATRAVNDGTFKREIVPVEIRGGRARSAILIPMKT